MCVFPMGTISFMSYYLRIVSNFLSLEEMYEKFQLNI